MPATQPHQQQHNGHLRFCGRFKSFVYRCNEHANSFCPRGTQRYDGGLGGSNGGGSASEELIKAGPPILPSEARLASQSRLRGMVSPDTALPRGLCFLRPLTPPEFRGSDLKPKFDCTCQLHPTLITGGVYLDGDAD